MWNSATLPIGSRFEPTDEELICYLARKVSVHTLPSNAVVECDQVYHVEPRLLPGANDIAKNGDRKKKMKAEALYFFVRMKKKTQNGYRPDRITGNGYWKASSGDQKIMVGNKEVGVKKMLSYFAYKDQNKESSKDGRKTDWVMHEYALSNSHEQAKKQFQQWTLCRISETGRSAYEEPHDFRDGCSHKRPYSSTVEAPAYSNYVSQVSSSGQIITQQVEEINEQQNQAKKHKASVTMEQDEASEAFISQELPSDNQSEIESATESCELPDPSSSEQWFHVEELLGMLDPPQEHADGLPNEAAGPLIPQELPSHHSGIESTSCEMESLPDSSSSTPLSPEEWLYLQELLGIKSDQSAGIENAYELCELPDSSSSTPWSPEEGWVNLQELLRMKSDQSGIESASQSCEMEALPDSSSSTPLSPEEWAGIENAYELCELPDSSSSTPWSPEEGWVNLQELLSMNSDQSRIESASQSCEMEALPDSSSSTPLSPEEWLYLQEVLSKLDPPQEHADALPNEAAEPLIPQELPSEQSGIESASKSCEMEALTDSSTSPPLSNEEWLYLRELMGMSDPQQEHAQHL